MKLIVHLGYPKTATTTLQNGVLYPLHARGALRFLGNAELLEDRAVRAADRMFRNILFRDEKGLDLLQAAGSSAGFLAPALAEGRPNVFSSEYLTLPGYSPHGCHTMPERLRRALGDDVQVKIILTVREPAGLLNSFFAHFFEWNRRYRGGIAEIPRRPSEIDRWVEQYVLQSPSEEARVFDCAELAGRWGAVFGQEAIAINLFEDAKTNLDAHLTPWAQALGVSVGDLSGLWRGAERQRVRRASGAAYTATVPWAISPRSPFAGVANRALRKLPHRRISIAKMAPATEEKLRAHLASSYLRLANAYGINPDRLAAHGYLPPATAERPRRSA